MNISEQNKSVKYELKHTIQDLDYQMCDPNIESDNVDVRVML